MTINALQRLCSMKNQAQFTPHKAETWAAALSVYPPADANRAILEQGFSVDPFPDLSKVLLRCEAMRRERDGTPPQGGVLKLGPKTVEAIAGIYGIEI